MNCTRSACGVDLALRVGEVYGIHRDTGQPYCLSCTRRINRACRQEVVLRSDGVREWK